MPSVAWTLQRELADSIIRCAPLDDIRILLACGAKVNEPVTSQGLRPLHYAAFQQYLEALQLLLVRGSDPDAMDEIGYTAMHLCAERGYLDLIRLLIRHKAKVCFTETTQQQNSLGNPPRSVLADEPLRLAIKNGHYEVAETLLQNGADPNARYFLGAEINLVSPLDTRFLELLLRYGANPDCRDRTGLTPLMKACRHPRGLPATRLLISYGADVCAVASERHDNRTPLHYAVLSGNMDTVRLLLSCRAPVRFPSDYMKPSPLDFAILRGDPPMVELLIEAGSNVNAGSPIIGCPLHIALSEKVEHKMEIASLLLKRGADPNCVCVCEGGRPLIKPPLGEYVHSCDAPSPELIRLLLGYGARVHLQTQVQHRLGILKCIHRVRPDSEVWEILIDAAESFSAPAINRCLLLTECQRSSLLDCALAPLSLKHISRIFIRNMLGKPLHLIQKVHSLSIPKTLQAYLLYDMPTV